MSLKSISVVVMSAFSMGVTAVPSVAQLVIDITGVRGSGVTTFSFSGSSTAAAEFLFSMPDASETGFHSGGTGEFSRTSDSGSLFVDVTLSDLLVPLTGNVTVTVGADTHIPVSHLFMDSDQGGADDFGIRVTLGQGFDFAAGEMSTWTGQATAAIDISEFNLGEFLPVFPPDFVEASNESIILNVSADGPPAAQITGTVTNEDGVLPIEGIRVNAYRFNGSSWLFAGSADTAADGTYSFDGLIAGTYQVGFNDFFLTGEIDYVDEYYDSQNPLFIGSGTDIVVTHDETVTGINATLEYGPSSIAGTVTIDETVDGLRGVTVEAFLWDGSSWQLSGEDTTENNGTYLIPNLTRGTYRLMFSGSSSYVPESYDDQPDLDAGNDVAVPGGVMVTGIDASLEPAGTLFGIALGPSGSRLRDIRVSAFRFEQTTWNLVSFADTYNDGFYSLRSLPAGSYRLQFSDPSGIYATQFYDETIEPILLSARGVSSVTLQPITEDFATWIGGFDVGGLSGFDDDPDGDGLPSGLENVLGLPPNIPNSAPLSDLETTIEGGDQILMFTYPENLAVSDVGTFYEWSNGLGSWHFSGQTAGGVTVRFTTSRPSSGVVRVTARISGVPAKQVFVRLATARAN